METALATLKKLILYALLIGVIYIFYTAWRNGISSDRLLKWFIILLGGLVILLIAIRIWVNDYRKQQYLSSPLSAIDRMTGKEFEEYLQAHFEERGYTVNLTPDSHDYGADLVCEKADEILIIQAKRYDGKVGNAAIQEIVAAKAYYDATECMVITNSYFSKPAIELAERNGVELWDRDCLNSNFGAILSN